MSSPLSRRRFIVNVGTAAAAAAFPIDALANVLEPPLYPPVDLFYFEKPIKAAPAKIRFGYASITWGGKDEQAIEDIAAVGFKGIQLRANVLEEYGNRPAALRDLLAKHRLEFVALSSGGVKIDPAKEADEVATHTRHAAFVKDAGGDYLQVTDSARPKGRKPEADDFKRLGRIITEIGKRTADLGIPLGYHNHMNSLGEAPGEVDAILEAADPRWVKLELDVAHYHQGGGDPVEALKKYRDRLLFLHIKDVESPVSGAKGDSSRSYRFVELGSGKVNLMGIFEAVKEIGFRGWAVVELDSVPDKARTPKESALISKKYLEEKIGLKV